MRQLDVQDLWVGYGGGLEVLRGLSLTIDFGEIICIVGPNGAGKSTLLRSVAGLLRPARGKVIFGGHDITGRRPDRIVALGLSFIPQERSVFRNMSVYENLLMGAYLINEGRRVSALVEKVLQLFPSLADRRQQRAGSLSGGEQRMLEMARAVMLQPRMVMFDEPSLGLEPRVRKTVFQKIRELSERDVSVLIVEQNVRSGLAVADRGYVLDQGRFVFEGTPDEVLANIRSPAVYSPSGPA